MIFLGADLFLVKIWHIICYMPELPEVETIRLGLKKKLINKPIIKVHVAKVRLLRNTLPSFLRHLQGSSFIDISRIGKLLIFHLAGGQKYLLVHLKMTGQLIYQHGRELVSGGHNFPNTDVLPNKYSHIIFDFRDGSHLYFNDMRQFGYAQIVDGSAKDKIITAYGLEPLSKDFNPTNFRQLFKGRQTRLKSLLLNQGHVAGIGNIYADEICWRAKVLPQRRVNTLTKLEINNLYQACQYIIRKAIANGGTTFSNYRNAEGQRGGYSRYLKVYGKDKEPCPRCSVLLMKKVVAGRGTHFCVNCQK